VLQLHDLNTSSSKTNYGDSDRKKLVFDIYTKHHDINSEVPHHSIIAATVELVSFFNTCDQKHNLQAQIPIICPGYGCFSCYYHKKTVAKTLNEQLSN
jgi:hypothetical protein